jgi:hypothetical protein
MAAPAFRAVGTASNNNNVSNFSLSPGLPSGTAADDILILQVWARSSSGGAAPTIDTPTGYTLINSVDVDISGQLNKNNIFWKRAGASESGPTVTGTVANGLSNGTVMSRIAGFSGCIASGTPFEDPDHASTSGAQNFAGPDITTTGADRLGCYFVVRSGNAGAPDPPSGWTEHYDSGFAGGQLGRMLAGSLTIATAQTLSGATCTATNSNAWVIQGLALIPPGAGGGAQPRFSAFIVD